MSISKESPYLRIISRIGGTRHSGGLKISKALLSKTGINANSRVLDVGCGAGHTCAFIAENFSCTVVGIDQSKEALAQARALHGEEPYFQYINFVESELSILPFSDGYFDVVLCESVLIFVKDKQQGLKEITRVLKPGGHLILNELCLSSFKGANKLKAYFARPELAAFLVKPETYLDFFKSEHWSILVHDERAFDIKEQLFADISQFGNKKGFFQFLEAGYQIFSDEEMRKDFLKLSKFFLQMPPKALSHLLSLRLLLRKNKREDLDSGAIKNLKT